MSCRINISCSYVDTFMLYLPSRSFSFVLGRGLLNLFLGCSFVSLIDENIFLPDRNIKTLMNNLHYALHYTRFYPEIDFHTNFIVHLNTIKILSFKFFPIFLRVFTIIDCQSNDYNWKASVCNLCS